MDETVASGEGMAYAFVMDAADAVLAHTCEGGFPVALRSANRVEAAQRCTVRLLDTGRTLIYDFAAPVTAGADRVGTVRLGMRRDEAVGTTRELLWRVFTLLGLSLSVAALVGFALSSNVTRRLSHLRAALGGLDSGHLDGRVGPPIRTPC